MANVKISELPLGELTSTSIFPFVDDGTTYQGAISAITATAGVVEVTYDELYSLYTGGTLSPSQYYLMTDFQTCYDQPNYNIFKNPIYSGNYKTGSTEPILLFATSTSGFSPTVHSTLYPKDKITYDITWNTTESSASPAKGRITERIDNFNNRTDYDHRNILFKRYNGYSYRENQPLDGVVGISGITGTTAVLYGNTGTTFNSDFSTGSLVAVTSIFPSIFEIISVESDSLAIISGATISVTSNSPYYSVIEDGIMSFYQPNVRQDEVFEFTTFGDAIENTAAINNYVGNYANLYNWNENPFILANNVFISGSFINNTIGNDSYNNTFNDDCDSNQIGDGFYNNSTNDDFDGNIIGDYFNNNYITANFNNNRIGSDFNNNILIGSSFYRNNIGNEFNGNTWTNNDFQNNEIGNQFNNNKIYYDFYNNDIGNGYNNNDIHGEFYRNLIGNGYNNNTIYSNFFENETGQIFNNNTISTLLDSGNYNFGENKIGPNFEYNVITQDFLKNEIGPNFNNNDISGNTNTNRIGEQFENNTIYGNFYDNQIFNEFKGNMMLGDFESNNVDSFVSGNQFSGNTYSNNISDYTFANDFLGEVTDNSWGTNFHNNNIDDGFNNNSIGNNFNFNNIGENFYSNNILNDFYENNIAFGFQTNQIGNYFNNNTIGDNFGYGYGAPQGNKIGSNFYDNSIGEYFYNNSIPDNFYSNEIGNYFQWNVINTDINYTNFTFNYGNITGFTFIATGTTATNGLYTETEGTTNGLGVNAYFDIEVLGGEVIGVSASTPTTGYRYQIGDTITISGEEINGSTPADDVVITVTEVTPDSLFYQHYTKQIFERRLGDKRVSFYDEDDILNVDSIYEVSGYIPVYSQSLTFPISYASFEFWCDGGITNNGQTTNQTVNNTQELVTLFNNNFRLYGYFFDNNDETIGLYINPSLKQQYCPSGTYTINVFND